MVQVGKGCPGCFRFGEGGTPALTTGPTALPHTERVRRITELGRAAGKEFCCTRENRAADVLAKIAVVAGGIGVVLSNPRRGTTSSRAREAGSRTQARPSRDQGPTQSPMLPIWFSCFAPLELNRTWFMLKQWAALLRTSWKDVCSVAQSHDGLNSAGFHLLGTWRVRAILQGTRSKGTGEPGPTLLSGLPAPLAGPYQPDAASVPQSPV